MGFSSYLKLVVRGRDSRYSSISWAYHPWIELLSFTGAGNWPARTFLQIVVLDTPVSSCTSLPRRMRVWAVLGWVGFISFLAPFAV